MKRLLIAASLISVATSAQAKMLDPSKPADALEVMKRTQCGEADGKAAVYYWSGKVYSRVAGEPDRHLFDAEGMNIRQCVAVEGVLQALSRVGACA